MNLKELLCVANNYGLLKNRLIQNMLYAFPSAKKDFEKSQYKVKKNYLQTYFESMKKKDKEDFVTLPPSHQ